MQGVILFSDGNEFSAENETLQVLMYGNPYFRDEHRG
jgi:hypothetical protein